MGELVLPEVGEGVDEVLAEPGPERVVDPRLELVEQTPAEARVLDLIGEDLLQQIRERRRSGPQTFAVDQRDRDGLAEAGDADHVAQDRLQGARVLVLGDRRQRRQLGPRIAAERERRGGAEAGVTELVADHLGDRRLVIGVDLSPHHLRDQGREDAGRDVLVDHARLPCGDRRGAVEVAERDVFAEIKAGGGRLLAQVEDGH